MPDQAREYEAARHGVALFDRSSLGKVSVTGRDRLAFLQGMLTNDVKALAPGQGAPAAFLDAHGKVTVLLVVYAAQDRVLIELPAQMTAKTLETLDHFLISEKAEFEAVDEAVAILSLQGRGARALLEGLAGATLDLAPYAHVAGPATLEILRIEAGQPWYPQDVDQSVILPETRLEALVSYTKGCYIGQETVARVKYRGHVNRALSGLVVEGARVPEGGARVVVAGAEVGKVTSAARSIALGRPIALGYVRREHFEPGTAVTIADGGGEQPARVSALPFVTQA